MNEHFKASDFYRDDQIYCDYCCTKADFKIVSNESHFCSHC